MIAQKNATYLALGAVFLWSTVASAFKISLGFMKPLELLVIASTTSLLVLAFILWRRGSLSSSLKMSKQGALKAAGFGFINPGLYYLTLFKAYDLLPAQEAQAINYSWALTMSLLAFFVLKQKLQAFDIAGLLLAYGGVFLISTGGNGFQVSNLAGVILALTSTIIWSLYWILSVKDERDPAVGLFQNFLFGTAFVLLFYCLRGDFRLLAIKGIGAAVYVGLFEMSLTFLLWLSALKSSKNTAQIGSLIFLSPFVSLILIYLTLGEEIKSSTINGLALILAGLVVQKLLPVQVARRKARYSN